MASTAYDFFLIDTGEGMVVTSGTSATDSGVASGGAATITAGDICVYANGYWAKSADGGCASNGKYGLALNTSTDTASADGVVRVAYKPGGGLLVRGLPTTASNLAVAILGDKVTLDVSGGVQKVDENDPNGVLTIVNYVDALDTIDVLLPYDLQA